MFECQAARWQPIAAFRGCRPWPHLEFDRLAMQADRSGAAEHAGEERIVAERSAAAVVGDFGIEGRTVERDCAAVLRLQQILTPDDREGMPVACLLALLVLSHLRDAPIGLATAIETGLTQWQQGRPAHGQPK